MTPYEQTLAILRAEPFNWTVFCSPAPNATNAQLRVNSPAVVAEKLDSYVFAVIAAGVRWGVAPGDEYRWACYEAFSTGREMWEEITGTALGQQHAAPVDTIGKAESPTQWMGYQRMLRNRLGEKLCSQEEFDRRAEFARLVPIEWSGPGMDPVIYQLAVREGYLPFNHVRFDAAYLQSNPTIEEVRGLSALMWLQNLQARDKGMPAPWLPGGVRNPAVQ